MDSYLAAAHPRWIDRLRLIIERPTLFMLSTDFFVVPPLPLTARRDASEAGAAGLRAVISTGGYKKCKLSILR